MLHTILATDFPERLLESPLPIFIIGGAIAIVAIIASTTRAIVVARSRERTKREIAAYVAEGTLDPEKAVAMLNAGSKSPNQSDISGCC